MSKRLCKLRRHDITRELTSIHKLVAEPKYLCRACARVSAEKGSLCKPLALTHSTASGTTNKAAATATPQPKVVAKRAVAEQSKPTAKAVTLSASSLDLSNLNISNLNISNLHISKKQLKQAKKALKGEKKQLKKLSKVLKRKQKVEKQARKLQKQLAKLNILTAPAGYAAEKRPSVH